MKNSESMLENCVVRHNVHTILKDILPDKDSQNNPIYEDHLFFRGESEYHEFRTPSLYLEKELPFKGSEYYYRTLLSELGRDDYQENTSLVRLLSELQHYGAKTRMLDITRSPLIALYFAVEKDDNKAGYMYIYRSKISKEKFDTGHTIAIKSALNFISQDDINNFLLTTKKLYDSNILGNSEKRLTLDDLKKLMTEKEVPESKIISTINTIGSFMELLNQRARVRERLIYPLEIYQDLIISHIVIPSKTTDRIRQQQGAFIFPKYVDSNGQDLEGIKKEVDSSIKKLTATLDSKKEKIDYISIIKIPGGHKKTIRRQLGLLGITEGFVYPDILHSSAALLAQYNEE